MTAIRLSAAAAAKLNVPQPPRPSQRARGVRHKPGTMNGLERAYAEHLEMLRGMGAILWWCFESITFKLADGCRYTPDFVVMMPNGDLEARETKGWWRDDARVKIKCAAEKYPLKFTAVKKQSKKDGGGWVHEDF